MAERKTHYKADAGSCAVLTREPLCGGGLTVKVWAVGEPSLVTCGKCRVRKAFKLSPLNPTWKGASVADLFDTIETYGTTCWVADCEYDAPERFTRAEAIADGEAHDAWHRANPGAVIAAEPDMEGTRAS